MKAINDIKIDDKYNLYQIIFVVENCGQSDGAIEVFYIGNIKRRFYYLKQHNIVLNLQNILNLMIRPIQ